MDYKSAYAFLKTHQNNGGIDAYTLFSEYILLFSKKENNKTANIINNIQNESGIIIPKEVSHSLLKKLRKGNLIEYKTFENYILTDQGVNHKIKLLENTNNAVDYKVIDEINNDLKNNMVTIELNQIIKSIVENYKTEEFYFSLKEIEKKGDIGSFFSYFEKLKVVNTDKYEMIKSILYSSIFSKISLNREITSNENYLQNLDIYLDSDILISLLGFVEEGLHESNKELIENIQKNGGNLKIFGITVNQVILKLNEYIPTQYLNDYPVDSMYFYMKLKSVSKDDIDILTSNFENRLKKYKIQIDYDYNNSRLKELGKSESFIKELKELAEIKRKDNNSMGVKHDIGMAFAIRGRRLKGMTQYGKYLEKCGYIILTTDYILIRHLNSKNKSNFIEAISSQSFFTYMWFKNPNINITPLFEQFIIGANRKNIISEQLWEKFLQEIESRIHKGEISEEDCHDLLAFEDTKKLLLQLEYDVQENKLKYPDFSSIFNDEKIRLAKQQYQDNKRQLNGFHIVNKELVKEVQSKNIVLNQIRNNLEELVKKRVEIAFNVMYIIFVFLLLLLLYLGIGKIIEFLGENREKEFNKISLLTTIAILLLSYLRKKPKECFFLLFDNWKSKTISWILSKIKIF